MTLIAQQATLTCTTVLLLKFLATTTIQGGKRFKAGSRPPEDASFKLDGANENQDFGIDNRVQANLREADARWQRIVLNDVESIPLSLIVAWASVP